ADGAVPQLRVVDVDLDLRDVSDLAVRRVFGPNTEEVACRLARDELELVPAPAVAPVPARRRTRYAPIELQRPRRDFLVGQRDRLPRMGAREQRKRGRRDD